LANGIDKILDQCLILSNELFLSYSFQFIILLSTSRVMLLVLIA